MNCYGSRVASLPPLDRFVLRTIGDARGIYRSEGVRAAEIGRSIRRVIAQTDARGRTLHGFSGQEIGLALARLSRRGMILRGARGWRRP